MRRVAAYLGAIILVIAAGVIGFIYSGLYNVSAVTQHNPLTFWILRTTMRESVQQRSPDLPVPDLSDSELLARGITHYEQHCTQCHGAPGTAPAPFAMGMRPVPPNLVPSARDWSAGDIFWTIKNGVQMTGMPAWEFRLSDDEIWSLVAAVKLFATIAPTEYQQMRSELLGTRPDQSPSEARQTGGPDRASQETGEKGDPEAGRLAILQYACISCHQVPGIPGPNIFVGPRLEGIANRQFIAGVLPNTPENMARWIRHPQEVDPLTAMPDMGVSEQHARDMVAYLYSLE